MIEPAAGDAAVVDPHDLARLDLADIAWRRSRRTAHVSLATHQWPVGVLPRTSGRMPHGSRTGFHPVGKQKQQAERPLQVLEHVRQRVVLLKVRRLGQQVDDDFGVGRALEDVAVLFVLLGGAAGR